MIIAFPDRRFAPRCGLRPPTLSPPQLLGEVQEASAVLQHRVDYVQELSTLGYELEENVDDRGQARVGQISLLLDDLRRA